MANLIYGLEYAIWGFDPVKFHIFDIATHFLVVMLLFWLVLKMFNSYAMAIVAALIFSIHPAVLRSLTEPIAAGDIPASFFFLLTFITFLYYRQLRSNLLLYLSLVFYVFALFSIETAYALWLLMPAWLFLNQAGALRGRAVFAIRKTWQYPLVAAIALAIRTKVLNGIGGYYHHHSGIHDAWLNTISFLHDTITLYPSINIRHYTLPSDKLLIIAVIGLITCAFLLRRKAFEFFNHSDRGKTMAFLLIWIVIIWAVIVATRSFSAYNMYFPAIPASIILSFVLAEGLKKIVPGNTLILNLQERWTYGLAVACVGVLICILSIQSENSRNFLVDNSLARSLYAKIQSAIQSNPGASSLEVVNYPETVTDYYGSGAIEHDLETKNLDYWLDASVPGRRIRVDIKNYVIYNTKPASLKFRDQEEGKKNYLIISPVFKRSTR